MNTKKYCKSNQEFVRNNDYSIHAFTGDRIKVTNQSYCDECHLNGSYVCKVLRDNGT